MSPTNVNCDRVHGPIGSLLNEVEGQAKESIISFFIGGLKPDIKKELKWVRPTTLRRAFFVAKVYASNNGYKPTMGNFIEGW